VIWEIILRDSLGDILRSRCHRPIQHLRYWLDQSSPSQSGTQAASRSEAPRLRVQHIAFLFDTEGKKACNLHVTLDPPAETKEDLHVDHHSNSTTRDNGRSNAIRDHYTEQSVASGCAVSPMAPRVLFILFN
jgi:hypothetical protein